MPDGYDKMPLGLVISLCEQAFPHACVPLAKPMSPSLQPCPLAELWEARCAPCDSTSPGLDFIPWRDLWAELTTCVSLKRLHSTLGISIYIYLALLNI